MADVPETLTTAAKVLLYAEKGVVDQVYRTAPTFAMLKKKKPQLFQGKQVRVPVVLDVNQGVSFASIPPAGTETPDEALFSMKKIYARISLDGLAFKAGRGPGVSQGIASLATWKSRIAADMLGWNINRALWNDGTGIVSKAVALTSATVIEIEHPFLAGGVAAGPYHDDCSKYVRKGMELTAFTSGGTQHNTYITVTAEPYKTGSQWFIGVTSGEASAVVDNDLLYVYAGRNSELVGLYGAIGGIDEHAGAWGLQTYAGLGRTSSGYARWRSQVIGVATPASETQDLTAKLMDEMCSKIKNESNGGRVGLIVTTAAVLRKYMALGQQFRSNDTMKIDIGYEVPTYTSPEWGKIPIMTDTMVPEGCMYFLDLDSMYICWVEEPKWAPGPIEGVFNYNINEYTGYDQYTATLVCYLDLIVTAPNRNGVIYNITIA